MTTGLYSLQYMEDTGDFPVDSRTEVNPTWIWEHYDCIPLSIIAIGKKEHGSSADGIENVRCSYSSLLH